MSTKQISINVITSYAQTGISIVFGFLCSRWVYNALGADRYGLFSVVGSIVTFIWILNSALSGGSSRFFAIAIGRAQKNGTDDGDSMCRLFNVMLSVHLCLAVLMTLIGTPIGIYLIRHVLNIPKGLESGAIIIFCCSIFSMFHGILQTPVVAMYVAKQYLFVINLIGILLTMLFAAEGYWLLHFHGDRLLAHTLIVMTVNLIASVAYVLIARRRFPEIRLRPKDWFDLKKAREIFSYSAWLLFGTLGDVFSNSGIQLVINKFFGTAANAGMGIGTQVYAKVSPFSSAIVRAVTPEIMSRTGAEQLESSYRLARRACIYAEAFALIAGVPAIVYVRPLLKLWLISPPKFAAEVVIAMIVNLLLNNLTIGYYMLIQASGKLREYQIVLGVGNILRCLFVFLILFFGGSFTSALIWGFVFPFFILNQLRVPLTKRQVPVSIRKYLFFVFFPMCLVAGVSFAAGYLFRAICGSSIAAILFFTAANVVIVAVTLYVLVSRDERAAMKTIVLKLLGAVCRRTA